MLYVFNEECGTKNNLVESLDESMQYRAKLLILLYNCSSGGLAKLLKFLVKKVHHDVSTHDLEGIAFGVSQIPII